jgi:hypothetical protein
MKMAGEWKTPLWLAAASAAALLAACDNGPSAVAGGGAAAQATAPQITYADAQPPRRSAAAAGDGVDHRQDPVKLLDGKPEWAASRRYSAEESAHHAYARNGEAFGATSFEDYVRKAHAFVEHPPKGVETLSRPNGDTLLYDPRSNIFAVADKSGAPRTMFKPDDGQAYWQTQKERANGRQDAGEGRRARRGSADDDA